MLGMCMSDIPMADNPLGNLKSIVDLVSEMKRCDECGITSASVAMAYICIDTLANLARPLDKPRVTRADFRDWVNEYLKGHKEQPYQYRGKDVYAARCAFYILMAQKLIYMKMILILLNSHIMMVENINIIRL